MTSPRIGAIPTSIIEFILEMLGGWAEDGDESVSGNCEFVSIHDEIWERGFELNWYTIFNIDLSLSNSIL